MGVPLLRARHLQPDLRHWLCFLYPGPTEEADVSISYHSCLDGGDKEAQTQREEQDESGAEEIDNDGGWRPSRVALANQRACIQRYVTR